MSNKKLQQELHKQHASKQEAVQLAELADMLAVVNPPGLSRAAKQRIASRLPIDVDLDQPKKSYAFRWAMAGLAGSFAVLFIVMTSLVQSALPDPTVYHAKDTEKSKNSDKPNQKDPVMQSQQIQQLESETKIKPEEPKKIDKDPAQKKESQNERDRQSLSDKEKQQQKQNWYQSWWSRSSDRWRD